MNNEIWKSVTTPSKGKLKYLEKYAIGKTLLDVGCAQGWYAKKAKDLGFKVLAVDIENFMKVKGVDFKKIAPGEIDPQLGKRFDTVLLFDVLEHIKDEEKALSDLAKICARRVIISVPNKDDKNLADYNLTLVSRKDKTHQRYYTKENLVQKLEKHGFKMVKMNYEGAVLPGILGEFVWPSFLGHLLTKLLNKFFFIGFLKSPYFGDIYAVADKKDENPNGQ